MFNVLNNNSMKKIVFLLTLFLGSYLLCLSQTKEATSFKVGAAKVDITPKQEDLPAQIKGIHDNLYVRAVVIDNGTTKAALISIDAGVREDGWQKYTQQIEKELGIPALNIFISSSHSHSLVSMVGGGSGTDPKAALLASNLDKAVFEVVKQAKANLQPARMAYGAGTSYLNVNRDVINPVTRLWSQGPNYEGASDKTLGVIKFETLTGEPIAIYYNYAMHPNTMFYSGVLSADFPGMASRYVEDYYDGKVVALWSMGAAGDQNPISTRPMTDVGKFKTDAALASGKAKDEAEAIMMGSSMDVEIDPKILGRQAQMISSLGQLLGEELLRVMDLTTRMDTKIRLYGSQDIVTCPGRTRTNTGRQGAPGTYVDGDSVKIKLSLLMLGDIALTGVNAEVYNPILLRLKNESSYKNLIMATTTNGSANSGYIPSDDAFVRYTFQVLSSRLQPGCAEGAIVNGLLDMMDKVK
jgi:neutral ceramidase